MTPKGTKEYQTQTKKQQPSLITANINLNLSLVERPLSVDFNEFNSANNRANSNGGNSLG